MALDFKLMGQKIKAARDKASLTQEQLAEDVDLSITHISAVENATSGISLQSLADIAERLEVSIDWLLFDDKKGTLYVEHQVERLLSDCTEKEIRFLLSMMKKNKEAIKEFSRLHED